MKTTRSPYTSTGRRITPKRDNIPEERVRIHRNPVIHYLWIKTKSGKYTASEIIEMVCAKYPQVQPQSVMQYIRMCHNKRTTMFPDKETIKVRLNGKLHL